MPLRWDVKFLVGIFAASGIAAPGPTRDLRTAMPDLVPRHREVIYASGVAELLAGGLLHPDPPGGGLRECRAAGGRLPGRPEDGRRREALRSTRFKTNAYAGCRCSGR